MSEPTEVERLKEKLREAFPGVYTVSLDRFMECDRDLLMTLLTTLDVETNVDESQNADG